MPDCLNKLQDAIQLLEEAEQESAIDNVEASLSELYALRNELERLL